jgi:hypothetical protein|nr:MAG TPA: hypothetical protein [Caudoviricetes sp.]
MFIIYPFFYINLRKTGLNLLRAIMKIKPQQNPFKIPCVDLKLEIHIRRAR